MGSERLPSLHLVGLSVLLATLGNQPRISHTELLVVLRRCGLRGGAIPWTDVLDRAQALKLAFNIGGIVQLSDAGRTLGSLIGADLEPTDDFERALALCTLGRSSERIAFSGVRVDEGGIHGTRLAADAVLEYLQRLGIVSAAPGLGEWSITSPLWAPVLTGLLLSSRSREATSRVGQLGEALTLLYLAEQGCSALHLSPIADVFGFDILGFGCLGLDSLAVEAKATVAAASPAFFLSRNELRVAKIVGQRYWVVVWPGVDDALPVEENYRRARKRGDPRIIQDPHSQLHASLPSLLAGAAIPGGSVCADGVVWTLS